MNTKHTKQRTKRLLTTRVPYPPVQTQCRAPSKSKKKQPVVGCLRKRMEGEVQEMQFSANRGEYSVTWIWIWKKGGGESFNIQQNPSLMKRLPHPQWVWKWLTISLKLNAALDALLCTKWCLIYYEASSINAWVSLSLAKIGLNLVCFALQSYAFNPVKHGWGWEGTEISFLLKISSSWLN